MALEAEKAEGPFFCPMCQAEVILHKGRVKTHHFAHKPPVTCEYGSGESEAHIHAKLEIFHALRAEGVSCELEKPLTGVRPDLYFLHRGIHCALEVQVSHLTLAKIQERSERYHALAIPVLWLPLYTVALESALYNPKQWEKWLHTAYLGRVYYWVGGVNLLPIHFADFEYAVNGRTWVDTSGETESAGSYLKTSRRFKTVVKGPMLHLLSDLIPVQKAAWQGSAISVPDRRILLDRRGRFWPGNQRPSANRIAEAVAKDKYEAERD